MGRWREGLPGTNLPPKAQVQQEAVCILLSGGGLGRAHQDQRIPRLIQRYQHGGSWIWEVRMDSVFAAGAPLLRHFYLKVKGPQTVDEFGRFKHTHFIQNVQWERTGNWQMNKLFCHLLTPSTMKSQPKKQFRFFTYKLFCITHLVHIYKLPCEWS